MNEPQIDAHQKAIAEQLRYWAQAIDSGHFGYVQLDTDVRAIKPGSNYIDRLVVTITAQHAKVNIGDTLTSADPEPPAGTSVTDDLNRPWSRDPDAWTYPDGSANWTRDDTEDDPETWNKIAGNYGPVRVTQIPEDDTP